MEGCIYLIKQFAPHFSPSERKVAGYLIAFPSEAVSLGVAALAKNSGTSPAAVIRLANRLGYKGYSELRMSLAREVFSSEKSPKGSALSNITASTSTSDVVKTMVSLTMDDIAGIEKVLDRDALEYAVAMIVHANNLLIAGIGASGVVATDFQQKLARLGILAAYSSDSDMQVVQSCSLSEDDVVVVISYSGESGDVLRVAKEAKKNHTTVIAITRIGGNSLSKLADITLNVPNSESLFREGATLSRISQLMVVDIIYAMILTRIQGQTLELIKRTWEAVSHVSGSGEPPTDSETI